MTEATAAVQGRQRFTVVLAAATLGLGAGWNAADIGPVADPLAASYGVPLPAIGLLATSLLLVHSLVQVPGGSVNDRIGVRRAGLAALVVLAAGNLAAAAAPNFGLAVAARALTGVGSGLAFITGTSLIRLVGTSALGQGGFAGTTAAAQGLALIIVPRLEPLLSWRAPYLTSLVVCALMLAALAAAPATASASQDRGGRRRFLLPSPPDGLLLRLAVLSAVSSGLPLAAAAWVVPLLTRAGESVSEASLAGSLILLEGAASRPLGGWLQHRKPAWTRPLLASSMVLGAAGTLLIVVSGSLAVSTLGAAVLGLAAGLPVGIVLNESARARPDAPATAVGFVNMWPLLAAVVATPLLGLAFLEHDGARWGFVGLAVLWALTGAVVPGLRLRR